MDRFKHGYEIGGKIAEAAKRGGFELSDVFDRALLKTMSEHELRVLREDIRAELRDRHERRVAGENNRKFTKFEGDIAGSETSYIEQSYSACFKRDTV